MIYWSPVCTPLISLFIIIEMGMNWLQQHTEIWRVGNPVKLQTCQGQGGQRGDHLFLFLD